MQWSALLFQFHFDDLFGIVPCAAGIGHKNSLIQTKYCDGDQVTDEEKRFEKGKSQGRKEDREKDIKHAFLRILCADLHYLLTVFNRSFLNALQANVRLNKLHRTIRTRSYCLDRCAGKPVDNSATGDQAENEWCVKQ